MARARRRRSPAVVHRGVGRDEPRARARRARHDRADGGRRARRLRAPAHAAARALPGGGGRRPPDAQRARADLVQAAGQLGLHRAVGGLGPALRRRSPQHPDGRAAVYAIWAEGFAVAWAEERRRSTRVLDVEPRELVDRDDAALTRMMAIAGNTKPSMLQDLEQGRADRGRRGQRRRRAARARAPDRDAVQRPRRRARPRHGARRALPGARGAEPSSSPRCASRGGCAGARAPRRRRRP